MIVRYAEKAVSNTLLLDANDDASIHTAARLLGEGKLVAFPTETVYGLGANALSAAAVAGIFAAKQRPSWDPLIVHIAAVEQLAALTEIPAKLAPRIEALAAAFWPGPLTLLLPRSAAVPQAVTAGRDLVGVRIPSHPIALALLHETNLPIAAPSANTFGHTSPTTAAHVLADLNGRIDAILDGGATTVGVESTVLDPTQTPMVLYRPGAVLPEQLTAVTGVAVEVFLPSAINEAEPVALPSPGVGIRHYAPRATLILSEGGEAALNATVHALLSENPTTLGVLVPTNWRLESDVEIEPWASWDAPEALASQLFRGLRALDDRCTLIVVPLPEPGGLRDALRDRLQKAARTK